MGSSWGTVGSESVFLFIVCEVGLKKVRNEEEQTYSKRINSVTD